MNRIIYETASGFFPLKKQNIGEFAQIRGRGMRFHVVSYQAEGDGSLCLMKMKAFMGLMKMESAVFSPIEVDGPLFSCDYIELLGQNTFLLELYDTTLSHPDFGDLERVKKAYAHLPSYDPGEHWYDSLRMPAADFKKGRKLRNDLQSYLTEYSRKYFEILGKCKTCDPVEKKRKNAEYADGLLQNGGPAVDQFVKMVGREKTTVFLKRYLFGAE